MNEGEWVYLIVQDSSTGQTFTIHDNRSLVDIPSYGASNNETDALKKLASGGGY